MTTNGEDRSLSQRPLLIAHRAGNRLNALAPAIEAGAQMIEIDVWHHRGRLEVGHEKTLGPVPIRWDRWSIARGRSRTLTMTDLLEDWPDDIEPMFDLKGSNPALPGALLEAIEEHLPDRPYAVSTKHWDYLDAFLDQEQARVVRSIGSEQALRRMRGEFDGWRGAGVGLDVRLLSAPIIEELRALTPLILTWTVNDVERAASLIRQGVGGIISDNLEVIRALHKAHVE